MALPLLLLPGLVCDADIWKHQIERLAAIADPRVADYGSSDSLADMASRALELVPGSARFAVAGHSMGGRVAFEIMRRVPQRVAGLAVLDTGYEPLKPGEPGQKEIADRSAFVELARTQGVRAMAREWMPELVHPSRLSDAPLVDSILDMMQRKSPAIFGAQVKALVERPDATPVLRAIRCPTLVICGREDSWSPLARHEQIASLIPGSKLVVIETCGHMATMERPAEVTAALLEWFSSLGRSAPGGTASGATGSSAGGGNASNASGVAIDARSRARLFA
jgi:pimeloyl-ACP methyl ester carboxylesterase